MNDILTELFIAAMYVGTILGMCMFLAFLAFVCRMGDLGVWALGWLADLAEIYCECVGCHHIRMARSIIEYGRARDIRLVRGVKHQTCQVSSIYDPVVRFVLKSKYCSGIAE